MAIEFRYRQKWAKATCECDQRVNFFSLKTRHGEENIIILGVECPICRHLHCFISNRSAFIGKLTDSIYLFIEKEKLKVRDINTKMEISLIPVRGWGHNNAFRINR